MTPHACPLCQTSARHLERLSHGWHYCSMCGRAFTIDEYGSVRAVPTNGGRHRQTAGELRVVTHAEAEVRREE